MAFLPVRTDLHKKTEYRACTCSLSQDDFVWMMHSWSHWEDGLFYAAMTNQFSKLLGVTWPAMTWPLLTLDEGNRAQHKEHILPVKCRKQQQQNPVNRPPDCTDGLWTHWHKWWWLFPHLQWFWENVWPFILCLHFLSFFLSFFKKNFFFLVEFSLCTLIPLFTPESLCIYCILWSSSVLFPVKRTCA